jgi:hypothetical protein
MFRKVLLSFLAIVCVFVFASGSFAQQTGGGGGGAVDPNWAKETPSSLEPFIGIWQPVAGEVTRADNQSVYPLDYGLLWISYFDNKHNAVDVTGFVQYKYPPEGWRILLGFDNPKYKFTDPGIISWSAKLDGSLDDKAYTSNYQIDFEVEGDTLTMLKTDKVSTETATFERVDTDEPVNPLAGGWKAVKGSVSLQNTRGIPIKTGRIVIHETAAGVVVSGNVYYERNKNVWFGQSFSYRKKISGFGSDTFKTISWSDDQYLRIDGKLTAMKTVYKIELKDDGTLGVSVRNRVADATAILKKEI